MVKNTIAAISVLIFLSSCSTFKQLGFTNNQENTPVSSANRPTKFIDEIVVAPKSPVSLDNTSLKPELKETVATRSLDIVETPALKQESDEISRILASRHAMVEDASSVQLKYAVLLNTEVESLPTKNLLESVDDWYGVRYRTGGNTKSGVDCSGFTVAVYAAAYGLAIPRVSREQYRVSRKISTTELQEGDLVFFNTNGRGVSHVGVYLGNNKFIHASVSRGVMVNDLYESYYLKRYIGAGRLEEKETLTSTK